jgi:hypothetical protein
MGKRLKKKIELLLRTRVGVLLARWLRYHERVQVCLTSTRVGADGVVLLPLTLMLMMESCLLHAVDIAGDFGA